MPDEHVYGEVENESDLRRIFAAIREDVSRTTTREDLTRLYRRAEYLVTLTFSPAWQNKFGDSIEELRRVAKAEFATTAREMGIAETTVKSHVRRILVKIGVESRIQAALWAAHSGLLPAGIMDGPKRKATESQR